MGTRQEASFAHALLDERIYGRVTEEGGNDRSGRANGIFASTTPKYRAESRRGDSPLTPRKKHPGWLRETPGVDPGTGKAALSFSATRVPLPALLRLPRRLHFRYGVLWASPVWVCLGWLVGVGGWVWVGWFG